MKKITLFLCALLFAVSTFGQTWKYTANTSTMTATITGLEEGTSYSGPLNIPATINYGANVLTVTSINASAFKNYTGITSVVIPEGAVSVGTEAFYGCTSLTSVTIPSTVTKIYRSAFKNCSNLKTVEYNAIHSALPDVTSTVYTGQYYVGYTDPPFAGDASLTDFVFGEEVDTIPSYLCRGLTGLKHLTIPSSVKSIGYEAFCNCSQLEIVNFESAIAPLISYRAFYGCSAINTINIPCGYAYPSYSTALSGYASKFHYDGNSYTIIVKSVNSNQGDAAITKEPTCDTYTATLTATPKTGYHFTHWSDNVTVNPYDVSLDKDTVLMAYFEINTYNLKVQSNEEARGSVSSVNGIYEHGTQINFEATPKYGYHFTEWSDGQKTNPRTLTITQDSTLTAIFVPNVYTITCGTSAYGQTTGAGSYDYLTEITLSATPNYGYKFSRWSDGITANPRVVRVERDSVITAEYAPLNYQVVVKTADKKMGSVQPNSAEWPYLSQVELTATPKYGYHFTEWNDGSNQNPHTITVEKDTVFTANFAVNKYTVNILGSSYGTAVGAGTFDYLTDTQIEAIPHYGYKFKQWSDGVIDNPRILTVESDTTLSMEFEPVKFTLRAISSDDNMGSVTPSIGKYAYLSEVTITAEPEYGYHFTEWNDARIANPRTIIIERDTAFEAMFEVNTYNIQVTSSSMGKVSGAGEYDYLSECTLRATANYGYQFVSWSDGMTANPRKFIVTQDSVFAAVYEPVNFTIEAYSANVKQGSVTPEAQEVPYMSTATITAVPTHGYRFSQWDDVNTENPRQITVTENLTFIATFALDSFNVVVTESEFGYAQGTGRYAYQSKAVIQAFANYGYKFVSWSDGITDNPRTINVEDDIELSMIFAPLSFTIRTQPSNVLRGTTYPEKVSQEYKSNLWISASANYGYHFTRWSDYNENEGRWVVVEEDKTYTAFFEPNIYTITTNAAPSNYGYVEAVSQGHYQDAIKLEAIANPNYQFVRWSDGETANPRTIILTQDTILTAEFEIARSGVCGNDYQLVWRYDPETKTLTIMGDGSFDEHMECGLEAKTKMENLLIENGVTSIGAEAFKGCTNLRRLTIGAEVKKINENAFYGCENLIEIYNYRATPANAYSTAFEGVDKFDCALYVMTTSVSLYQSAAVWRDFYNIEPIGAENETIDTQTVHVEAGENTAIFTWPVSEDAEIYSLQITKDGEVFCVLTFNANGQLVGIAFAPGRDGQASAPAAITSITGMSFTVTGLSSANKYGYHLTVTDFNNTELIAYSGEFATIGYTGEINPGGEPDSNPQGVDDINAATKASKIFRDGQVLILRGDKTYTLTGQEVK